MKKKTTQISAIDDRLELLFRHAGMMEKQAKLYRLLLAEGEGRVSVIARKSGINRVNVYALLRDLATRGVVVEFEKDRVVYFRPEPPEKIIDIIEGRKRQMEVAKTLGTDLLPQMTAAWKSAVGRPVVRYFEGEEGVKKVFEDVYAPGKSEVIGCVGLEEPSHELYEHIIKRLMPLRIRRKIFARALNPDSPRARELKQRDREQLREIFLCDPKRYPLPAEIDIYQDTVAFLSFERGDFVGVALENRAFATTMRSIFTLLFDLLRESQGRTVEKAS